eukprot:8063140-Pyramimonas_sp.AAC.1
MFIIIVIGTLQVWNTRTRGAARKVGQHKGHTHVASLELSGDGKTLFSGGSDGMIYLWQTEAPTIVITTANTNKGAGKRATRANKLSESFCCKAVQAHEGSVNALQLGAGAKQ